ncbi:MAG: GlxA family transcriptional regulator [Gammaproteobacteria bacterium]
MAIRVAVLAIDHVFASSLAAAGDAVHAVNRRFAVHQRDHAQQTRRALPPIACEIVSADGGPVPACGGLTIAATRGLEAAAAFDAVFVPAIDHGHLQAWLRRRERAAPVLAWLKAQHRAGAVVAACATGVFLLAEAGLLRRARASVPWMLADGFRRRYPDVRVEHDEPLVEHELTLSAGAVGDGLPLALRMLRRFVATAIADQTETDLLGPATSASLAAGRQAVPVHDPVVARAQYLIQQHFTTRVSLAAVARELGTSQRTLIRRFHRELCMTPQAYLQTLRIDAARRLLERTDLSIRSIAERVGYTNAAFFRRLFIDNAGIAPRAVRERARKGGGSG